MTEANNKKSIYVITDNANYDEQVTLVKLTKEQADAINWFTEKFDIGIDILSVENFKCEDP